MLCGLKMGLKRLRVSAVLPEHHEAFKRLLKDPVVKRFLVRDKNLRVSDKIIEPREDASFHQEVSPDTEERKRGSSYNNKLIIKRGFLLCFEYVYSSKTGEERGHEFCAFQRK
ncbi:putative speedy protein-like protein 3 [Manis javanica]|nr:putative speedy protein-like protein 3 [Manis javanica]